MLRITWLGQSGYLLRDEQTTICIDPYLSDAVFRVAGRRRMTPPPLCPQELSADAIICTHNHLDHLDTDTIPQMDKRILFLAPLDCKDILTKLGILRYSAFDEGTVIHVGGFELRAVFADHTVPAVGVIVKHGKHTLYFTGDTQYHEKLTAHACDILFVCINGKLGNMNAEQATRLAERLAPKTAVPNHYDMFESNSADPVTLDVPFRFIMNINKEYEVQNGCLI